MLKQRKQGRKPTLSDVVRQKKMELIRQNPDNSIVYEFKSPVIRERFSKKSREALHIKNITIELWGYLLTDEDKRAIEEKFNSVLNIAKEEIINFTKEFGDFDYLGLMNMSAGKKIRKIPSNHSLVDVFVPESEEADILFEALFRIDTFDKKIKRSQKAKGWVELLKRYEDYLNDLKESAFTIFERKVQAKHLAKFQNLRKEFIKWIKTKKINQENQ